MSQTQSCRKDDQFSIKKPVSLYIGLWSNSLWFIAFRPKQQILIVAISMKTAQLMRQIPGSLNMNFSLSRKIAAENFFKPRH
jgi:hypothetical protein